MQKIKLKDTDRKRNWTLTIFEEAECWGTFEDQLREQKKAHYGYILHDQDIYTKEDEEEESTHKEGTPKRKHYHVVVEYESAPTFSAMKKKFPGAHIEPIIYKKKCYQYLIHKNDKDKHSYDSKLIITDDRDYLNIQLDGQEFEYFDQSKIIKYIADGEISLYRFIKRFGLVQANKYWRMYSMLLDTMKYDKELTEDVNLELAEREEDLPF